VVVNVIVDGDGDGDVLDGRNESTKAHGNVGSVQYNWSTSRAGDERAMVSDATAHGSMH